MNDGINKWSDSWVKQPDYHGWFYRFASRLNLKSISHNCGLEGINATLKRDYTHRESLGFSRTLLMLEQLVADKCKDPERQVSLQMDGHFISLNL
jgi:hypothetical protein